MAKKSFWAWGLESEEPTVEQMREMAVKVSRQYGVNLEAVAPPKLAELSLRKPRISPPASITEFCSTDTHDRAVRSYGRGFRDRIRAFNRQFPNPPDVVAFPRNEQEVEAVLGWCSESGHVAIPYGAGSSVVGGVEPPEHADGIVSIDLSSLDRVLEIDQLSRAARIQAGVYGPAMEDQLRPHGFTLRHFPQSFEHSTLGGWIATRSGGHYATNQTHIDDMVESVRMVTPTGIWESRRLPGSGAGPSPDRMVIGSEGILGIITEAWMKIQGRPKYRASAGVTFPTLEASADAARIITQSKLWPANCRVLDPGEAANAAGLEGSQALLVLGFESADVPQDEFIRMAIAMASDAGGTLDDDAIKIVNPDRSTPAASSSEAGRQGAVGNWRDSFIRAPYTRNMTAGLGLVGDTLETAITWDRWPQLDAAVRDALNGALRRTCGGGSLTCRFTHVYPDGPAPYYTFEGLSKPGGEIETCDEIKAAASDAIIAAGGTITHHHAVGKLHRPWYDKQRPDAFAQALRAAKGVLDPKGVLNPGVLIDP
ncbi:MAG TPA: FAD-binding oxidoreductase [Dehalococcoidia bacterium]|nr:FAD-binding oxidoreductase [Dehalococcoidia bacterium]